jgi:hypothetical protein
MATDINALQAMEGITSGITNIVKKQSIAFQICDVQYASNSNPSVFAVAKGDTGTGLKIVKKACELDESANSDEFTDEIVEDIFNLFGVDATDRLKVIAANTVADDIDSTIIAYMKTIATAETPVTYDFGAGTAKDLINALILEINRIRVQMSLTTQRGLPKHLIVSAGIASLLITNKIISGNDSDYVAGGPDNIKFLGKIGDMMVYHDLEAVGSEFILFAHKTYIPGDASMIIAPINAVQEAIKIDSESGEPHLYYKQRFAYSQNPLDVTGAGNSEFIRYLEVTLTGL